MRMARSRWTAVAVAVAGCATAGYILHGRLPQPGAIGHTLVAADRGWLAVAAAAELASMVMFAVQQRLLLHAFGGSMSVRDALLVTFARTGMSVALPAGAAVSAAYALRHYRRRGATAAGAAALIVLAGVQAIAALLLIYVGWFAVVGFNSAAGTSWGPLLSGAAGVAGVIAVVAARRHLGAAVARIWRRVHPPGGAPPRWRWVSVAADTVTGAIRDAAALSPRGWALGAGAALGNWLLDLGCLLAVARACGLPTGVVAIIGTYLLVQVVRQVPITPGGIGVVEASLLVGLVAAGATGGTAAAVVLIYRLLSCWLMAPIGLLAGFALHAGDTTRRGHARAGLPAPGHTRRDEIGNERCTTGPRRSSASSSASTARTAPAPRSSGPSPRPAAPPASSRSSPPRTTRPPPTGPACTGPGCRTRSPWPNATSPTSSPGPAPSSAVRRWRS